MARFLIVPQWQGSPAARAMHLVDGADAIAGDLPRAATVRVEVPTSAGEAQETGIRRFSALARTGAALTEALAAAPLGEPVVVVGGDCGVAVPAIAHAAAAAESLAVVWFDAHGDLHTPLTSPSGAFAGMALRAVIESLPLSGSGSVPPERVFLAGAREIDEAEEDALAHSGITHVDVAALGRGGRGARDAGEEDGAQDLAAAVAATGATALYVHVDLDVLDPTTLAGVALPVPFGLSLDELLSAIAALRARIPLVGASISGFAPASPAAAIDDLGAILRVVGALA
ncbi:arginase family protein [Microbacterium flavum]|uniref:arginase family protein n=1 Tax=Microbacterium flavum TaxID=415216 RepID=UPI0024AE737E|nr:arginase family protein [Microbacterium flavum]